VGWRDKRRRGCDCRELADPILGKLPRRPAEPRTDFSSGDETLSVF